jgi:cell division protein FtsI (penicillin-binding protein 3)
LATKDKTVTVLIIEWAYKKYLNGKDGKILKQKNRKGQWKPIRDINEVDPQDRYDVISTIDVYIKTLRIMPYLNN